MAALAVIKTGGKQYLVKENDELFVDHIKAKDNDTVELETLALFNDKIQMGTPLLEKKAKAVVMQALKADKIRVSRFKAKVRYRKVRGFRAQVSKIKIVSL